MKHPLSLFTDPLTQRRLQRFKAHRRAYVSFLILATLYVVSLGADLLCNDRPLIVRYEGKTYFPLVTYYPASTFSDTAENTRPHYRALHASPAFADSPKNSMLFPLIPYGPHEVLSTDELSEEERVTLRLRPAPRNGFINVDTNHVVLRASQAAHFFGLTTDDDVVGRQLSDYWELPDHVQQGIRQRFANNAAERIEAVGVARQDLAQPCVLALSTYKQRRRPPRYVRLTLRETEKHSRAEALIAFTPELTISGETPPFWHTLSTSSRSSLTAYVQANFDSTPPQETQVIDGKPFLVSLSRNDISWPYKPTRQHWMGVDNAGRDVFARTIYAFRISVSFGLILVTFSMLIGIAIGAVQGYYGGVFDITTQRMIEIWSALPFLYVMILMGSVFGRKFSILLLCYGVFNWIGISYYIRAEFLRLRSKPFVEAARCMGIPAGKIMRRHILPNAITPAITLFPFGLVSAIYALVALDYLGFGLPPLTPSWGELLHQAQGHREAWWLIVFPSASLFVVMILGVFIGEGIRDAFDPREYSKME
ncbi:MAG: microcin C transport system permease protein [Kiritimatiellia bacterium]